MTPTQIDLARHALGLDDRHKVSYRNHFVTGEGSEDHAEWMAMVEAGDSKRRRRSELTGGDDLFVLTPQGARAALRPDERLDLEDFPPLSLDLSWLPPGVSVVNLSGLPGELPYEENLRLGPVTSEHPDHGFFIVLPREFYAGAKAGREAQDVPEGRTP